MYISSLICAPLSLSLAHSLRLPLMASPTANTEVYGTAYTVSVHAIHPSMNTGISARDRALTSNPFSSKEARPEDLWMPGHLSPLRARSDAGRERRGHSEATVEFCRLAGKRPAGALCELVEEGVEDHAGKTKRPEVEERRCEDQKVARGLEDSGEFLSSRSRRWLNSLTGMIL